jgi:hypothetical protein
MKQHVTTLITSLFIFAAVPVAFAWTAAPSNAPQNNVPAPINVGAKPQLREGWLGIFGVGAGLTIAPDTGYKKPNTLLVGVNGGVGAREFCNETGTICGTVEQFLKGGNTTINNTTTGCKVETSTFSVNVNINAQKNDTNRQETFANLMPGTWTVKGSGKSVKCGGSNCGNNNMYIAYTNKGSRVFLEQNSKKSSSYNWSVDKTFTITENERLYGSASQALLTGSLTLTGPKLVCNN